VLLVAQKDILTCTTGELFAKLTCNGPLAQLAEQLTLNQPVGGSSPPRLRFILIAPTDIEQRSLVGSTWQDLFMISVK
jgi:hypothetical protein